MARQDSVDQGGLKDLVVKVRDSGPLKAVVLVGSPDGERVALAGASTKDSGIAVNTIVGEAAKVVGGGGGGKDTTLATAGGRNPAAIDDALALVRQRLGL